MLSRSSALGCALRVPGALAVSLADLESGSRVGLVQDPARRGQFDADSEVMVRMGMQVMESCGPGEQFEELVVSSAHRFHLLRAFSDGSGKERGIVHLELDRSQANLALALIDLRAVVECFPAHDAPQEPVRRAPAPPPPPLEPPQGLLPRRVPRRQPSRERGVAATVLMESPELAGRRWQGTSQSTLQRIAAALRRLD